jgi:hypothetical protein
MLKGWLVLKVMRHPHQGMIGWGMRVSRRRHHLAIIFIIVVSVLLSHKVLGTFMFVRTAILHS